MAINTIDGFYIGSANPVDNRITAANSTVRTAIVYKYDGLKVLQLDTRENWIWNQGLNIWQLDSNASDISGTENVLSKFMAGTGLTNSIAYNDGLKFGINTNSPDSVFQVSGQSGDNFNMYVDSTNGAMLSYNWYYHFDASNGNNTTSKDSVRLRFTVNGGMIIDSREANAAAGLFTKYFEINDSNGYNYLKSPGSGSFVSGSASFGTGTSPYSTQQLVYVDGSMRTNSSMHKSIVWIFFNGVNYSRRRAYSTSGVLPSSNTTIGGSYTIASYENEIVMHSTVDTADINLTTLNNAHDMGREVTITLEGTTGGSLNISSTTDIVDLNGDSYSPSINRGDSIKFMSIATSDDVKWKTMYHVVASSGYPESWKYIGNAGTMLNGESIPAFSANNHVENSGIANKTNVRLRKIDDQHIHIQGVMLVKNYSILSGASYEMDLFRLPSGYRPIYDIFEDALINDDSVEDYFSGQYSISQSGFCRFYFYNSKVVLPTKNHSYITIDQIIAIDY